LTSASASKPFVLLAQDPGTANFGYAILKVSFLKRRPKVEVLQFGRLLTTVRSLKDDLRKQVFEHQAELSSLDAQFGIDAFIAERYQSRRMGGTSIECINLMLGVSCRHFVDKKYKLMPASQWKNAAAKAELWFDDLYTELKPLKITPHAIDAVCIGLYGVSLLFKLPPYEFVNIVQLRAMITNAKHLDLGIAPEKITKKKKRKKVLT
jgi:hypothetical protein